jgi:hypothetical protein
MKSGPKNQIQLCDTVNSTDYKLCNFDLVIDDFLT